MLKRPRVRNRTGALTVVISPLVALMADQVTGLKKQGISSCVTVNGLLSLPGRHDALDQVRLGDAAMLLISPEQLRNPSVRSVLDQREVGYWVVDEAHCVSKWGHDFRPDYRYIARFIREYSSDSDPAPLICLTATAKPGVIEDICEHFEEKLGIGLERVDGGAHRDNLSFEVVPTEKARKLGDIVSVLEDALPAECQRRRDYAPVRRRKNVPRARWQLVPVVHGRDPVHGKGAARLAAVLAGESPAGAILSLAP